MLVLALVFVLKPPYPHANAQTPIKKQVEVSTAKAEPVAVQPTPPPQPPPAAQTEAVATPQPPIVNGTLTDWMAQAGISPADYGYVSYIVGKESGGRYTATNASSGAYGLCQSLPASKMASAGADWQTNPVTQLRWCNSYAVSRYGGWANAYSFWVRSHWW